MEIQPLVLLIEDEDSISAFITAILTANHYRTQRAVSGKEGLSLASSNAPDVILLDLGLPDMDGVEVLRELRTRSKTPVIIVSARGLERIRLPRWISARTTTSSSPSARRNCSRAFAPRLRHSPRSMSTEPQDKTGKTIGELTIDFQKHLVTLRSEVLHLTPNEYKLLALLSVNAGKVLTHDALIREVWDNMATRATPSASTWQTFAAKSRKTPALHAIFSRRWALDIEWRKSNISQLHYVISACYATR